MNEKSALMWPNFSSKIFSDGKLKTSISFAMCVCICFYLLLFSSTVSSFSCPARSYTTELSQLFTTAGAECSKIDKFSTDALPRRLGDADSEISWCLKWKKILFTDKYTQKKINIYTLHINIIHKKNNSHNKHSVM